MEPTNSPPHVSYSSLSTYADCGKRYELSKILKLPEQPSWWSPGGSAVHAASETFDRTSYEGAAA